MYTFDADCTGYFSYTKVSHILERRPIPSLCEEKKLKPNICIVCMPFPFLFLILTIFLIKTVCYRMAYSLKLVFDEDRIADKIKIAHKCQNRRDSTWLEMHVGEQSV